MKNLISSLGKTLIALVAALVLCTPALAAPPQFLWQNEATGDVSTWIMNGASVADYSYVDTVTDSNWVVAGTADLFQNGNFDVIWQNNATGDIVYWELSNATLINYGFIDTISDTNWKIESVR